ncbi:22214_t:CDS:2 [Rhizophagus irregularis]|nr:22214_t:CDS:2 [Rhizophagus irregularis]
MSSKSTVTDPQTQTPTKNIILSYSSNFTPTINNTTSLRNAHRNVMAHTRNSSSPASYFNSNSTSHRRVYSAKSILRESYSGNSKSLKSKESNNIKNNDEEIHRLINSDSATIEKSNDFPESSYAAANSSDVYSQTENINRRSSISLSSSSSIRSVHPFTHIHKKRLSRTIQHISSFIQIVANITSTISVPITIEKTYTVERLARQIEAEYAFKFGGFEQGGLYEPLEVGLLYDVSMISLRFRDLVGDVLEHGDVVNVLNIYEGFNDNIEKDDSDSVINILPSETKETKTSEVKRYSMPIISPRNSTILPRSNSPTPNTSTSSLQSIIHNQKEIQDSETRFQAVLSNTLAINYFQKFAIKEYSVENLLFWLDVELFAAGNSYAPLQVNISDEIRRDINWPIDDDDVVERNMFDEAQEAVYQLMKGYTFIGFEDSPEWQECARRKKLEPKEYQSYEMTKSLESYFHPNMSIMLAVTMAHDPSIKQPPVSHHYKEQTLHTILSQYFPETILLDNRGIRRMQCAANDENPNLNGYFDNENRLTNAQRMRKIKKERKLKWVFGERINRMDDQIVVMPDETLYGNGRIGYGDDDDTKSISSTISENRKVAKDVWNKKKKVEKLESIFGRGLKDSQLYSQNILNEKRDSLTGTLNSPSTTPQTQNFNSETPDSPQLQTMNELSANDRRMLWKKTKKLQIMFGEALDEDIVRQALTLPVIQSTPGHSPNSERFSSDRSTYNDHDRYSRSSNGSFMNKQINRRASDSMISPLIPSESTSNTITSSIVTPPASPPVSLDEKLSNKHTIKGVPSINPDTVPLIIVNKDTKEYRRKKLQKLYRFLGEKVPINAKDSKDNISFISNTSNTLDQNDVSVTKLSAVDRKRHLQRAVKLQKMFGETPPQNLIFSQSKFMSDNSSDCSSIDLHRRSIMSLEYLMENDRETMYELINYMENSDEGENQEDTDNIDSRRKSSPPTPYSSSPSTNFALPNQQNRPRKQKKLKGIRKLSHFFGATYGQMFPDQVLGELLGDLEREIRDEAKQNNQLDKSVVAGLMDQLEELRAKTSEFGPDSGDEGGTTEGSAITDDEYSLEGLRRALERNGKNRSFDSEKMLIRTR